jgi:hypothetical protein
MTGPGSGPPPPASAAPVPSWLQPLVSITTNLGFPVVVAGLLLWFVLTRVDGAMRHIQAEEDLRTQKVADMQTAVIAALERNADRFERAIQENIAANRALAERHRAPER